MSYILGSINDSVVKKMLSESNGNNEYFAYLLMEDKELLKREKWAYDESKNSYLFHFQDLIQVKDGCSKWQYSLFFEGNWYKIESTPPFLGDIKVWLLEPESIENVVKVETVALEAVNILNLECR